MGNEITNRRLMQYDTAEFIRLATQDECEKSDKVCERDGGVGAFTAIVEGEEITCYVEAE